MKVLIAVRSKVITRQLVAKLSQYEIHTCHTGKDALVLLEQLRPDGLIIDLCLPVVDGLTVLRTSQFRPYTILAITTLATGQVISEAAAVGVKDTILIPCSTRYVAGRFEALLQNIPSLGV